MIISEDASSKQRIAIESFVFLLQSGAFLQTGLKCQVSNFRPNGEALKLHKLDTQNNRR